MRRLDAIEMLGRHSDALKALGAAAAYLFGSTARDCAGASSDIDLFIDVVPGRKFSLIDLAGIKHYLEDELAARIDVVTRESLHPLIRAEIEREALRVV